MNNFLNGCRFVTDDDVRTLNFDSQMKKSMHYKLFNFSP